MNIEAQSLQTMKDHLALNRDAYHDKLIDLYKVVISLSGVMLTIVITMGMADTSIHTVPLVPASLLFLLAAIFFGLGALHGYAEHHQQVIVDSVRIFKTSTTVSEALVKINKTTTEPRWFYKISGHVTLASFCSSLILLTVHAVL